MFLNVLSKRLVVNLPKNLNSHVKIMSQTSILSFFKKQTVSTSPANVQKEKSPSPKTISPDTQKELSDTPILKKRKRINVSSDSEEETTSHSIDKKKCVDEKNEKQNSTTSQQNGQNIESNSKPMKENDITTTPKNQKSKKTSKTPRSSKKSNTKETKKTKPSPKQKTEVASEILSGKSDDKDVQQTSPQKETDTQSNDEKTPDSEKVDAKPENKTKTASVFLINKKSDSNDTNIEYHPDKKNYHPIDDASWKHGEKVPYLALAKTLQKIEEISARLKIIEILSNYLRSVIVLSPNDLLPSIYLCLNKLGPAYEGLELGIADMYLMKAIAQCTGRSMSQIKSDVASTGDLGIVAEKSRSNQRIMFRPAPLTVQSVFNQLVTIANISGHNAMTKKVDKIEALFVACRDCEARFVIRSLAGKMRIGLAEQSVLQALAIACTTTPPNQQYPPEILNASESVSVNEFKKRIDEDALILKNTFCECPNYNMIVPVLLKSGIKALPDECKITPGLPVKPMLAQPTKGAREVLERFEGMKFTCEWKYDGERAQIHLMEDGKIKIYSRNQEDNTSKYPDIIANIREMLKPDIKSFILDTEAVAWDREKNKIMPFQVLSTRKRKDADKSEIKVQVCVFMFDLLYFNGASLIQKPLIERRTLLKENFQETEGKFMFVLSIDTNTMEEVQEYLEASVKGNCEGLMVKTLDTEATYEIAKRSRNWLKLKKDYLEGVGDTLDLVAIGGYTGKGKRTGNYGGFLLASYDEESEEYQAICKIGTGFSDEILAQHTEFFKNHTLPEARPYYRYDSSLKPDQWFDAVQVWEVKCADLSLSPVYHAAIGLVDPEKGISLRFPRFLRIRDDKSAEQATTSQQVAELYRNQDQIKNQTAANTFNEEDF